MEHAEREWRPPAPDAPVRRVPSRLRASPRLRAELGSEVPWVHPWSFGPGARARVVDTAEAEAQQTLTAAIEDPVREALAMAAGDGSAIDLGCGEGWVAHRLLNWGAARVLGVESDPTSARRAGLIAQEVQAPLRRLEFREVAHEDWRAARLGRHDVVLCRAGVGKVEDPIDLLRRCARMTSLLFVLDTPLHGDASRAALREPVPEAPGTFELRGPGPGPNGAGPEALAPVPDVAAVVAMLRAAGFWQITEAALPVPAHARYVSGERGIFFARTAPERSPSDGRGYDDG